MASGASRRAAKRASMQAHAQAERLNNLRSMAERDVEREGEAFPMGRAKLKRGFAKRGSDTIGMHATVGISEAHDGALRGPDGSEHGCDDRRFYTNHRVSDLPRTRATGLSPRAMRFEHELKQAPMGRLGNGRD